MAEKGTEAASPLKKKRAHEQGDLVRSRELISAVALMVGVLALGPVAPRVVVAWRSQLEFALNSVLTSRELNEGLVRELLRHTASLLALPLGVVMSASFTGALSVGAAQSGGLRVVPAALALKFDRLNPFTNLTHLFSLRTVARLLKSLVPASVMMLIGISMVKQTILQIPVLSVLRLPAALNGAYHLALDAAAVTLVWSAVDYAVEWSAWNKRMRMTKQQLKEEMKEAVGNPQVKGRIRQAQQVMRRRRVKADMSRASVVITNPTHYAVALEFSFETMAAPRVLAKGRDLHAAEIREEARWAGVPLIENPPLARSLYRLVEAGQAIPFELYAAVASILAYLYRQKVEEKLQTERQQPVERGRTEDDVDR